MFTKAGRYFHVAAGILKSHSCSPTSMLENIVMPVRRKACLFQGIGVTKTVILPGLGPRPQLAARAIPGYASGPDTWRPCGAIALFHL